MSKNTKEKASPVEKPHGYEFFGPYVFLFTPYTQLTFGRPGVAFLSICLPVVCYLTTFLCNDISGCPAPSTLHPKSLTLAKLKKETGWPGISGLVSTRVTLWVFGYYLLSLVLQAALPGEEIEGGELRSGGKLKYKFNGTTQQASKW